MLFGTGEDIVFYPHAELIVSLFLFYYSSDFGARWKTPPYKSSGGHTKYYPKEQAISVSGCTSRAKQIGSHPVLSCSPFALMPTLYRRGSMHPTMLSSLSRLPARDMVARYESSLERMVRYVGFGML